MMEEMNNATDSGSTDTVDILDFAEHIQQSASRCKDLLDSWRNFGNKSNSHDEIINVYSLVKEVVTAATPMANAINANIEISADCEETTINGNSTQIFRALQNLVGNAVQALPQYGGQLRIKCTTDKNNLSIQVIDNGSGIHEDKLDNIFKPYFTTKKLSGGTGLGLYMVKTIVEGHLNGEITLISSDEGACFMIVLKQ